VETHVASGSSGSGGSVRRSARTACSERWSSFSHASTTAVQLCTPPRGWRSQPRHAFTPCTGEECWSNKLLHELGNP